MSKNINLTLTEDQFLRLLREVPLDSWLYPIVIEKAEAMQRREAFTRYRTAEDDKEKFNARIEYLKLKK